MSDPVVSRRTKLRYVQLGTTDMMVSECCGGTMMWGSFVESKQEAHAQLDALVEAGVNFIDTAELYPVAFNYGRTTEEWIGEWLNARTAAGTLDRSKFYISTKCNMAGAGGVDGPHGYERGVLEDSCRASIARLRCEYIDLYQLHWPSRDTPIFGCSSFFPDGEHRPMPFADHGEPAAFDEQVLAIKALLDAGLIRHWGLSNENSFGITMFCLACDRLGVPRPVACEVCAATDDDAPDPKPRCTGPAAPPLNFDLTEPALSQPSPGPLSTPAIVAE